MTVSTWALSGTRFCTRAPAPTGLPSLCLRPSSCINFHRFIPIKFFVYYCRSYSTQENILNSNHSWRCGGSVQSRSVCLERAVLWLGHVTTEPHPLEQKLPDVHMEIRASVFHTPNMIRSIGTCQIHKPLPSPLGTLRMWLKGAAGDRKTVARISE